MSKRISKLFSAELVGIDAKLIEIEVDINVGQHAFTIVGLADKALNEARERVSAALKNSGAKSPNEEERRVTVNLAPADIKKTGSQYDLGIALAYLLATGQIKDFSGNDKIFLGELALDGRIRPINGALNFAQMAASIGISKIFLPLENANEASIIDGVSIFPVQSLSELIDFLEGEREIKIAKFTRNEPKKIPSPDFSEIKKQDNAKRALTIAAAGGHNLLMIGPPGVGKSFLAYATIGILPDLTLDESIEVTKIWSAAGMRPGSLVATRPFRSPHATASIVALVGGGQDPKPGEISLAHRGILFLDELPEFHRATLESLRQPIESGYVHVARAKNSFVFPARFSLIAAMNPCPCGYHGDTEQECRCSAYEILKYQKKISGPLLDRIDIQIKVSKVKIDELREGENDTPTSPQLKLKVESARLAQKKRFTGYSTKTNADMGSRDAERLIKMDASAITFLDTLGKTRLSPRGYYRVLKVAQTIADLDEEGLVSGDHLAEAFGYRLKEGF